tara:strand:+ start:454 stop:663 length:210 start_codon:yes stop_codon:yes gene_type:complete
MSDVDELALERHKFSDGRSCVHCGSADIDADGLQMNQVEGALSVIRRVRCNNPKCDESYTEMYELEVII